MGRAEQQYHSVSYLTTLTGIGAYIIREYVELGLIREHGFSSEGSPLYCQRELRRAHMDMRGSRRDGRLRYKKDGRAVFSLTMCYTCGEWCKPWQINRRGHCATCAAAACPPRAGRLQDADA